MGMVFVLDRRTGVPLFPVEERPVPKSDVEGEVASATQPFSSLPSLSPLTMPLAETFGKDRANEDFCRVQIAALRYDGIYTPPSLKGSLVFPGAVGGVNWGSAAYDPTSGVLYANTNRLPYAVQLVRQPTRIDHIVSKINIKRVVVVLFGALGLGVVYLLVQRKMWIFGLAVGLVTVVCTVGLIWYGIRRNRVSPEMQMKMQLEYALQGAFGEDHSPQSEAPYSLYRHPILDHHGLPCISGLWGTVEALNLQTGKIVWEQAHGTQVEGKQTGSLSLGGVIVTAGGMVFAAGTREPLLRAYDAATGEELWRSELPDPAQATPMTYEVNGRQFVVIAAGGHGSWGTKTGDAVVAFGLN
jgi:quinoprotein glucose dehydrogenase